MSEATFSQIFNKGHKSLIGFDRNDKPVHYSHDTASIGGVECSKLSAKVLASYALIQEDAAQSLILLCNMISTSKRQLSEHSQNEIASNLIRIVLDAQEENLRQLLEGLTTAAFMV